MLNKLKDILNTYTDEELDDMTLWINEAAKVSYILINEDNISLITTEAELKVNGYIEQEGTDKDN